MGRIFFKMPNCKFMGYPLTLNLFWSMFRIKHGSNKSYYSARVVNQDIVVALDLSNLRDYYDRIVWVRVP